MGRLEHRPSKPFIYGWAHTVYSPCRWHVLQVATASIAALDRPYGTAYSLQLPSTAKSVFLSALFSSLAGTEDDQVRFSSLWVLSGCEQAEKRAPVHVRDQTLDFGPFQSKVQNGEKIASSKKNLSIYVQCQDITSK